MKLTSELIERFFRKECTSKEARQVVRHLNKNPAEVGKYLDREEWDNVPLNSEIAEPCRDEVWAAIRSKQKRAAQLVLLKKSAVAAALIAAIFIVHNHFAFIDKNPPGKTVANKIMAPAYYAHVTKSNNSNRVLKIVLQDSSLISMYPGAVIRYDVPFQNNKREISLNGEALFSVAKNKAKPFIVSAGLLTTTALGTRFKITTGKSTAGMVNVKLFSGKVVIRPIHAGLKGWSADIYLLPGQQMKYDESKMLVSVDKIISVTPVKKIIPKINAPVIASDSNELNFEGAALPYVMDELSKQYAVKIEFTKTDIMAMSFTGGFNKKDSLTKILQLIGQMNDLTISQEDGKFIVQKMPGK